MSVTVAVSATAQQPDTDTAPVTIESSLADAELIGEGAVSAYSKAGKTLLILPKDAFERMFLWYSETVTVPTGVDSHLWLGGSVVRFEQHGASVFIRNLTASLANRIGDRQAPEPGQESGAEISPIAISVRRSNEPPVAAILPVIATAQDGRVLVDVTALFSGDIDFASARSQVAAAGLVPVQVLPDASYITSVRVFPENFNVRTHLTFVAKANDPIAPPRNISMRISHSLVMLPDEPMEARQFDPRVGFFRTGAGVTEADSEFTVYEESGRLAQAQSLIMRYRLEKKEPGAAVSDPVKPIVFYIGREVPDRWRPYLKAAVESWQPVFEAAGFSNAIVARDAPSFADDPDWTPEDVRYSTVRWLARPTENATGPHTVDPRSGEILSSHVEVWPGVITIFSRYYYGVHASLDSNVTSLPLSEDYQGRLLQYAVAHEVGHAIGLRHNHLASTVYSVDQLRDPAFANALSGATTSLMSYGRWNQAAQPGDGITKFMPDPGPYDFFAVKWGYGEFAGPDALAAFTDEAQKDRRLLWAAGELGGELELWSADPRVLMESTGSDRVEATRLGVANFIRSVERLSDATRDDDADLAGAYSAIQNFHMRFLRSVTKLIGGVEAYPWATEGPHKKLVPADQQRAAIQYLMGEGARSLNVYLTPELVDRVAVFGGTEAIADLQASLVDELFEVLPNSKFPAGIKKLPLLQNQKAADPDAYGPLDFASDSYDAIWGDLETAPNWRRSLQRAYLDRLAAILAEEKAMDRAQRMKLRRELAGGSGLSYPFAASLTASNGETVFPAWAREMLPKLAERLDVAAARAVSSDDRYHFLSMATRARQVVQ
ncbi:zinc-dependent metalloprotease [Sedimentitalea sp. JM2-8]|uniref:Zinc-dependent metalloprotease n=1 Tax=Sedimentitalea xiamensis TaxID=3050037 RepID=A0ABT7FJC9_9RHOB|nr:zinc-dependent metalloprotease [Sedimentitalea xiamensis]MDK3075248.1 zinc-dependent metalloprotease [Sedimentitalea xiamensis]